MTGLEKIIKVIEEDATIAAEAVIAEAKREAEEINSRTQAECLKKRTEIATQSELEVKASLSRAESAALLQEKKLILYAKQQIISEVIERAKESLIMLSDKEYFDVILKMIKKHALDQSGQILFSTKDRKRLPVNFQEAISTTLLDKKGASLLVSDETMNLDGGFVLIYGDVEENCSFEALFFAAREELQDKVCAILFE